MPSTLDRRLDIRFIRNNNLMDNHTISKIINERQLFIQKDDISIEDCLGLIKIELNVMDVCSFAIKTNRIPETWFFNESKNLMEYLCNRINHIYFSTFQMFSIGSVLLIEYMEFQSNYAQFITYELDPLIEVMSKEKFKPQMYITAATFEYKKKNIENARRYFIEGIKHHTDNKLLYLEQLWIEVMYFDDGLDRQRSIEIYRNSIRHFDNDMEFHISLLDRSLEIKQSTYYLQFEIICDLMKIYKESDFMWHKVATLCLKGFVFYHDMFFFGYSKVLKERARCCIQTYHKGLKHVSSDTKKWNLMKLLSEYIIQLWKSNKVIKNSPINSLVITEIQKAFQIFHFDFGGLQKPEYYIYWAIIPREDNPEIFQLAIDLNKDNPQVWAEMLEYNVNVVDSDSYIKVKRIFDAGYLALGNKSLPLWKIMDSFLQQYNKVTLLGEFYKNAANSPYQEINTVYKLDFLDWRIKYDGILSARTLLTQLLAADPENLELHMSMIEYEKLQIPINLDMIRNLFRIVCLKFCRQGNNVGVWEKFIEFELKNFGSFSAKKIYMEALKTVMPDLKHALERNYQLINEAHSRNFSTNQPVIAEISGDAE